MFLIAFSRSSTTVAALFLCWIWPSYIYNLREFKKSCARSGPEAPLFCIAPMWNKMAKDIEKIPSTWLSTSATFYPRWQTYTIQWDSSSHIERPSSNFQVSFYFPAFIVAYKLPHRHCFWFSIRKIEFHLVVGFGEIIYSIRNDTHAYWTMPRNNNHSNAE